MRAHRRWSYVCFALSAAAALVALVLVYAETAHAATKPTTYSASSVEARPGPKDGGASGVNSRSDRQLSGHLSASTAHAAAKPLSCDVTGHLEASPGHVTAVFHVGATCREVSLLSWLAPDAHAGLPQTLYDRHAQRDVPPGDYRWTITRPDDACFQQSDLRIPGHNVDALLGGTHQCPPPSTTTTTSTPSSPRTTTSTPTTSALPNLITSTSVTAAPSNVSTPTAVIGTRSTPTELPHSGSGEVGLMAAGALSLIGLGRWVERRGLRRRQEAE